MLRTMTVGIALALGRSMVPATQPEDLRWCGGFGGPLCV
jgi:hypothetical protein